MYPLKYHDIVEAQKINLMKTVDRRINKHYKKVESVLFIRGREDPDKDSLEKLNQFYEIALKIRDVPSWPFSLSDKIGIFLSALVPWIVWIVDYLV